METTENPAPNFCSCSDFSKTFDSIYSSLPFNGETFAKREDPNYHKFVLSETIRAYPFSSTYIYCRVSCRKAGESLGDSSKRMMQSELRTEDESFKKDHSNKDLPSLRSLLTLGICVIYTAVLLLTAAVGSRLLSSLRTIVKYALRFVLSIRLKSTRKIKDFSPQHSGT